MKTILKFTTGITRKSDLGERIKGWHALSPIGATYTLCGISYSDENGGYEVMDLDWQPDLKCDQKITCRNCIFIIEECKELKEYL
jgi:hypothetical protein